jgi:hypothetical protein
MSPGWPFGSPVRREAHRALEIVEAQGAIARARTQARSRLAGTAMVETTNLVRLGQELTKQAPGAAGQYEYLIFRFVMAAGDEIGNF